MDAQSWILTAEFAAWQYTIQKLNDYAERGSDEEEFFMEWEGSLNNDELPVGDIR